MINGFKSILELCKNRCMDKESYISVLNDMQMPEPVVSKDVHNFGLQLQGLMDCNYEYVVKHSDEPYVRLKFGEQLIYKSLWHQIKDSGIGHLSSFNMPGNYFEITVHITPGVSKGIYESEEDYQKRKIAFFSNCRYSLIDTMIGKMIADTEENRLMLKEWFKGIVDFYTYEEKLTNGFIREVKMFAKNITLYDMEEEKPDEFDQSSVERIMKYAKESIDALDISGLSPGILVSSLGIATSSYYYICKEVGLENEYCINYANKMLSNKEKNEYTNKRAKEIGSSVSVEEVLSSASELSEKLNRKFANDLCFCISKSHWHDGSFYFSGFFSKDCAYMYNGSDEKEYMFDDFKVKEDEDGIHYRIDASYIREIKHYFESQFHAKKVKILVETNDNSLVISEISGYIDDLITLQNI